MSALLRLPTVMALVGLKRTAIYDRIGQGLFTAPIKLGARASVWPEHEVTACNEAIINGAQPEEIKALVRRLHEQRRASA